MSSKQFWQICLRPMLSGSLFIFLEGKVTWRPCKNRMGHTYLIYTDVNFFIKYQLPQTAQTCALTIYFALTFFQNLTTKDKLFTTHILQFMEVTSHLSGHVNLHNITTWDSNNAYAGQSQGQPAYFVECTVTGVLHLAMLEEFLMPTWEKRTLIISYSSKMEHPCIFIQQYRTSCTESFHGNGQADGTIN